MNYIDHSLHINIEFIMLYNLLNWLPIDLLLYRIQACSLFRLTAFPQKHALQIPVGILLA